MLPRTLLATVRSKSSRGLVVALFVVLNLFVWVPQSPMVSAAAIGTLLNDLTCSQANVGACFSFADFSSTNGLALNGNAFRAIDVLRLTSTTPGNQAGSAWYMIKQNVSQGFSTLFDFQITPPGGADGFAFVIQNSATTALGGSGGYMGYDGIPDSLAVEFDTHLNNWGDISDKEISVHTNSINANSASETLGLLHVQVISPVPFQIDGLPHAVKLVYTLGVLEVFLDDLTNPVLVTPVNLGNMLSLSHGTAFVGFTAGTGSQVDNHDILDWSFSTVARTSNVVQNGDFSNGLLDWNPVKVRTLNGVKGEYPIFKTSTEMPPPSKCTPPGRRGSPILTIDTPFGANGYAEQQVTIPSSGTHLSFVSWGWENSNSPYGISGLVNASVAIADASGAKHILETFTPPAMLNVGDPSNPNDDTCTGYSPVFKSYDLSAFSGQTVKLRLGSDSNNCCGTLVAFDDVDIEAPGTTVFLCPPRAGFQALPRSCALPNASPDKLYSYGLQVAGGVPPYDFSIDSGRVPPGMVLGGNGTIHGTPNVPGIFPMVLILQDSGQSLPLYIPITITVTPIITGISPGSGLVVGGTAVNITGIGFIGATDVNFNSTGTSCGFLCTNFHFTVKLDTLISIDRTPRSPPCGIFSCPTEVAGPTNVTVIVNGRRSSFWCLPLDPGSDRSNNTGCNQFHYLPEELWKCSSLAGWSFRKDDVRFHASLDASPVVADAELSGSLDVNPKAGFCVHAVDKNLQSFNFNTTVAVSASLFASVSLKGEYDNSNKPFILAGPFQGPPLIAGPIIIVPTLTPVLIVSANISGTLTARISHNSETTFGIKYTPSSTKWTMNSSIVCRMNPTTGHTAALDTLCIEPDLAMTVQGHVKVAIGFEFSLLFYDLVGPVIAPDVYLRVDGGSTASSGGGSSCDRVQEGTQSGSLWGALCGGLEVGIGAQLNPWLGYVLPTTNWTPAQFDLKSVLLAATVSIKPSDPGMIVAPDGTIKLNPGQSVSLTATVAGSLLPSPAEGSSWNPSIALAGCGGNLIKSQIRAGDYTYTAPSGTETCSITFSKNFLGFLGSIVGRLTSTIVRIEVSDFSLNAAPSRITISQGSLGSSTITLVALNGFTGRATLSTPNLPIGFTSSFTYSTVASFQSSVATIAVASSVATGSYIVHISGTGGSQTHGADLSVMVTSPPDFAITAPQTGSFGAGGSTTLSIGFSGSNGFTGPVILSLSSSPGGLSCTLNPTTVSNSQTATLTCSGNRPERYVVTITGTSGSAMRTTSVTVTVTQGLDPTMFYLALGGITALVGIVGATLALRRRKASTTA